MPLSAAPWPYRPLDAGISVDQADSPSYLLIESSGISEPIQVAETFTPEFASSLDPDATAADIAEQLPDAPDQTPAQKLKLAELIQAGGLNKVARLDTCVSVVDCTTFFGDFETADFLTDRNDNVDPQDERNITDLSAPPFFQQASRSGLMWRTA